MSWVATGVAVGSAVIGAEQGNAQRKAQAQANRANMEMSAAQTEFSPWTKINPTNAQAQAPTTSGSQGAMQGALSGAMFAAQNKMGGFGGVTEKKNPLDAWAQNTTNMDYKPRV